MLKKVLCACVSLMLLVSLTACQTAEEKVEARTLPEHPVQLFFEALQRGDYQTVQDVTLTEEYYAGLDIVELLENPMLSDGLSQVNHQLTYSVRSTELRDGGDSAIVTVEVTYPDIGPMLADGLISYLDLLRDDFMAGTIREESEYMQHISDTTLEMMDTGEPEVVTETIGVLCEKRDGVWYVYFTEALYYPISSGSLSAYFSFMDYMSGEAELMY